MSSAAVAHYRPEFVANLVRNVADAIPGGSSTLKWLWYIVATLHICEAMYAAFLCGKHRAGPYLTVILIASPALPFCADMASNCVKTKWTVAVLLAGFPVLGALRATIQKLRIDSIKAPH
jgi:hypothetical protein